MSPLLNAVLETTGGGIAVLDAGGRLLGADCVFLNLAGYHREDIPGLSLHCLCPLADDALAPAAQGRISWNKRAEITRKDGGIVHVVLGVAPAKDPQGTTVGFVVRARRAPAEETIGSVDAQPASVQRRRLEHQLRNMLTVVAGNIDLMDRAVEDQALRRRLELVQAALGSAREILDRMQQLAS